ncbi:MAG: hypothetical protein HY884_08560 [Deltaproteobacteria bacterium]|nr:hypothetical protein [Deltaproteobacteria bacterium]
MIDWLADAKNRGFVKKASYAALVLVFGADFFVHRHHGAFFWDNLPGYGAVYGFISCIVIIIVSKAIGHAWLMKKEDYYD